MILIVVEHANGKASKSTYEMATCARELGREGPLTALVLGSGLLQMKLHCWWIRFWSRITLT